jgi:Ca-activated chloride channel family protein
VHPTWRSRLAALPTWLQLAGLALGVFALARPVERVPLPRERSGVDVMLVLDVSSSMGARDLDPQRTRLQVAVDAATRFAAMRPDDRFGLVRFARYPDLRCPPTLDHDALTALLTEARPVVEDGAEDATGIGAAVALAADVLGGASSRSRVVILLTDGEENVASTLTPGEIAPLHAGQLCASLGVRVHAITVGSGRRAADGSWEPVDTAQVEDLATRTGGGAFLARDAGALDAVYARIDALERSPIAEPRFRLREEYQAPLGLGLLLAAIGLLLAAGPLRVRPHPPSRARGGLAVLAVACGSYAWTGPLGPPQPALAQARGMDVVACLDLSRSMLADDLAPSRLARAQADLRALAERGAGDRFALVVFAGEAALRVPPTADAASFARMAEEAHPTDLALGGTDLAVALDLAAATLARIGGDDGVEGAGGSVAARDDESRPAAVLLLSDGEDRGGRGRDAAIRLRADGVPVHAVGYGTARGSRIAVPVSGGEDFVRDADGAPVLTRLESDSLRALAAGGGGAYGEASVPGVLVRLYERELLPRARVVYAQRDEETRGQRYPLPLAVALLLGLMAFTGWHRGPRPEATA